MGTAEVTSTCFREDRRTREMLAANYPCYCHAAGGLYFTIALNQSGGISLEWFQKLWTDLGGLDETGRANSYARALGAVRLEPSPVVFLPHLVGSGTPSCDHRSRGTFLGLSLSTSRDDMFQAVVEALAFEARLNLATLDGLGIPVSALLAVGGGARSRAVLELKATVLRRPIRTLSMSEAALLGAAMQAQVAVGEFRDLQEARSACVRIAETIQPRAEAAAAYDEAFRRFEKAYSVLPAFYREEARS
jgi:xylulokinase